MNKRSGFLITLFIGLGLGVANAAPAPFPLSDDLQNSLVHIADTTAAFIGKTENDLTNRGGIVQFSAQSCVVNWGSKIGEKRYQNTDGFAWCQCFANTVTSLNLLFNLSDKYKKNFSDTALSINAFRSAAFALPVSREAKRFKKNNCQLELADVRPGWIMTFARKKSASGHTAIIKAVLGPHPDGTYELQTVEGNIDSVTGEIEAPAKLNQGVFERSYRLAIIDGKIKVISDLQKGIELYGFYPAIVPSNSAIACASLTDSRRHEPARQVPEVATSETTTKELPLEWVRDANTKDHPSAPAAQAASF